MDYIISMGRAMFVFASAVLLMFSSANASSLRCPPSVQVELGTDGVISCDVGFKYVNLYWYSGTTFSDTPPIARLEQGVLDGSEGFDITTNGSLVVLNADVSREGMFTLVVFHLNNTYEHSSVSMEIFANPIPYFPVIGRCNGTHSCTVPADSNGSLECSIYGSRPVLELNFLSHGVHLFNVIHHNSTDVNTGISNTSVTANYETADCAERKNITCVATGFLMQEIKSTLTFIDTCPANNPTNAPKKGSAGAVVITLVIIVIIVIAVVVTVYFIRKRRLDYQPVKLTYDVEVTDYEGDNQTADDQDTTINNKNARIPDEGKKEGENKNGANDTKREENKKQGSNEKRDVLVRALSDKYQDDYFRNASKEDDRLISIDDVYVDLDFEVKHGNDETKTFKINDMFLEPFKSDKKMKIFISNKTQLTFSSQFAYLWSKQQKKENILFVFDMRDLSYDISITTAVKQLLQNKLFLTEDEVYKIIKKFGCHIIFEGVDIKEILDNKENERSESTTIAEKDEPDTDTKLKNDSSVTWTLSNVLRVRQSKPLNKSVVRWAITYDTGDITMADSVPCNVVHIKDIAYIDGIDDYVNSVVDHYCHRSPDEKNGKLKEVVKERMLDCELKKKFDKAPLLLMQMIHVITKRSISSDDTSSTTGVGSLLIESLPLLKTRYMKKVRLRDMNSLTCLEEKLGEVAFKQMIGKADVKSSLSEDMKNFSLSIGLIKQSNSSTILRFPLKDAECFLVASYLKDKEALTDFINQTIDSNDDGDNDKRYQILSFICTLHPGYSQKICEKILKIGKMRYFVSCFSEATNAGELHDFINRYFEKEDFVINNDSNRHYIAKVRCLLKYCKNRKITLNRIRIEKKSQKDSGTAFIRTENFDMPIVDKIIFYRLRLNEDGAFMYYIDWIMSLDVKRVSFECCDLPELSVESFSLKNVFNQSKSKVAISKVEIDGNKKHKYDLNKDKLKWVHKETTKVTKADLPHTNEGRTVSHQNAEGRNHAGNEPGDRRLSEDKINETNDQTGAVAGIAKTPDGQSSTENHALENTEGQTIADSSGRHSNLSDNQGPKDDFEKEGDTGVDAKTTEVTQNGSRQEEYGPNLPEDDNPCDNENRSPETKTAKGSTDAGADHANTQT